MADDNNTSQQRNQGNQGNRQQRREQNNRPADKVVTAAAAPAPAAAEEKVQEAPAAPEVVETLVAETPVVEDAAPEVAISSITPVEGEDPHVTELKQLLADFVKANNQIGSEPKDFKLSAQRASQLTRFVIQHPRPPVLTAMLAFFRENANGVCRHETFLRGVTELNDKEQQKVGFLYNFFDSMISGKRVRLDTSRILHVLGRSEFVSFFNRRQAAAIAASKQ